MADSPSNNDARQFGGEVDFDVPPERLFAVLTDLDTVAATIPDLVSSERVDERTLKCVAKPGFSFLRGTMKMTVTLGEMKPTESATMQVESQGIGVSMKVTSQLHIAPRDGGGSRLTWQAKVTEMRGLVATVSPSLVRAAAERIIGHAWEAVGKRVSGQ